VHIDMVHEKVVYQNPFLCIRIWQIDGPALSDKEIVSREKATLIKGKESLTWHYHKEVEFLLVLHGAMTVYLPEEQFLIQAGDVTIFGPSEPHTTQQCSLAPLQYLVFQLDLQKHMDQSTVSNMKYFANVLRPLSRLNYIVRENGAVRDQIAQLILSIYKETEHQENGYELAVSAMIKNIFLLLVRNDSQLMLHYQHDPLMERIQPVLQYIDDHLAEKMVVEDMMKQVNLSYHYFIKVFKKAVGMSFTEYVNFKRIKKAEQMLLTEDRSIAEVAELVGISNIGHFYDMFNRFNSCSPKHFKDRLSDASISS
jgi:AraC-like DNA-binding protein/mannose-6-phosphate isomerase-like protein (cupin superfamily)